MTDDRNKRVAVADTQQAGNRAGALEKPNSEGLNRAETEPTLVDFFSSERPSASAFIKSLKKHDVKRFRVSDQDAVAKLMPINDPDLERLWALVSQASLPEPIDAWIWGATQARLKECLGDEFDPHDSDPERILRFLSRNLSSGLSSEPKDGSKRTENLLRVAICWLVEKRALKPWYVARKMSNVLFKDLRGPLDVAQRAVQKGKTSDFRLAAAMVALGDRMVQVAEEEQNRERDISTTLRQRLDDANSHLARISSELANAKIAMDLQEKNIAELTKTLADERQHWGHDLTETIAEQRALLGDRLGPLLSDAIDALEIEPPAPGTALRRLKAALLTIDEAKE